MCMLHGNRNLLSATPRHFGVRSRRVYGAEDVTMLLRRGLWHAQRGRPCSGASQHSPIRVRCPLKGDEDGSTQCPAHISPAIVSALHRGRAGRDAPLAASHGGLGARWGAAHWHDGCGYSLVTRTPLSPWKTRQCRIYTSLGTTTTD